MKIEEIIDYLKEFNQKAEFKIVTPDGLPLNINKNNFGWSAGGEGGTPMIAVEVYYNLNDSEILNNK